MTKLALFAAAGLAVALTACSPAAPKGDAATAATSATPDATATVTPTSASAVSPRAFVDGLYGQYKANESFSPFTHPEQWFDAELMAAIKEDETLANGEIGFVDGDPICSCQDASGMEAQVQGVEQTSPTTAVATVKLWAGGPDERPLKVMLVLVGSNWRVHDVTDGDGESFLTALKAANAAARAAPH